MTELYKWEIDGRDVFIDRLGANGIETMTREEAESRLNEYETLKAATERLSAEMATKLATMVKREWEGVYSWSGWQPEHDALKAYASILEGKDENE